MTKSKWKKLYDKYSHETLMLMAKIDTLNREIDSLKKLNNEIDQALENFDSNMLELVGNDENSLSEFRVKFNETEKKIDERISTPEDVRRAYFEEISNDPARCLSEFSSRFEAMRKKFSRWEGKNIPVTEDMNSYTVKEGDTLWKIALEVYKNPDLWVMIWEANKDNVLNAEQIPDNRRKLISNPNRIYPGQVLKIPKKSG